jgi:hypothetical protein
MIAVPPHRNSKYLVMGTSKKRICAKECPSGEPMLKIGSVDIIERVIQSEVCTHDLHRDNVIHGQSCGLNGSLYTIHDEFRFNPGVFRGPVSLGIYTNMTGNIKGVTNKHSVTKWQRRARSTARSIYKLSICLRASLTGAEDKQEGKRNQSYRHFFSPKESTHED